MIRYKSSRQLSISEFKMPFEAKLDENNRWVCNLPSTLGSCIGEIIFGMNLIQHKRDIPMSIICLVTT